ncbi:hypothetical protein [Piscinibacter sp. HJYY11]|uniref:hypothetical protein n=1 Tax=Piscinibacter sp. HJYY11 TaxID=2801333 RepID=UPI00191F26BF|nr:hypothetical protein [Piscinibacter sp. HJYY11]MBL0729175.1 hypothetical protein [Piscinibacter sp. HJYY11]
MSVVRSPLFIAVTTSALVLGAAALMARPARTDAPLARVKDVCASKDVRLRGEPHRLLAMCTRSARESASNDPGRIDLYLLKRDAEGWQPVAQKLGLESGRMGQPGEVSVLQLGPSLYGFEISETSVSQGYLLGGTRLYVPRETGFQVALDVTSTVRNTGTHECAHATPAVCSDFSRRLKVEVREGVAAYPLRITSLGHFRGEPVSATHVLSFDAKRAQYRLPAGFEAQVE